MMESRKILYKSLQSKYGNFKVKLREVQNEFQKEKRYNVFCGRRTIFKIRENLEDEVSDEQIKEASKKLRNMKEDRIQLLKMLINGFSHGSDKIQAYIECDPSLTCLVGLLLGSDAEVILLSAWCLTNMATGSNKQASIIIKHASPYLITLLSSHAPAIQDQCAWALGNLASSDLREELLIRGILNPLLSLLRSPSKNVIKSAAFAISNMMRSELARKDDIVVRVVDEMMNILSNVNEDEEILSECLWTLLLLVPDLKFRDDSNVNKFVDKLLKLLTHHTKTENLNVQMLTPLVRILGNICCQWLSSSDAFETFKISEFFIAMERVIKSNIHHVQKEAIWMLSNMSAAHCQLASAMIDHSIDETINMLFESDSHQEGVAAKCEAKLETEEMDFESFKI